MFFLRSVFFLLLSTAFPLASLAAESGQIEYLGKVAIGHSEQKPILGISSLRFDAKTRQFILLSDDTGAIKNAYDQWGNARYYTVSESDIWDGTGVIELGDSWADKVKEVMIAPNSSAGAISKGHIDTEGLALMDNGEVLISSEQDASYSFEFSWDYSYYVVPPGYFVTPSLVRVNGNGELVGKYQFPDYYKDDRLKFDIPYVYDWASNDPDRKGIARNKGFESLDRFQGSDMYLAITEGPLLQDSKDWSSDWGLAPSRMVYFSMKPLLGETQGDVYLTGEYFYQQNPLPENLLAGAAPRYPRRGVTDMQIVNEDTALVLERAFIKYKAKKSKDGKVTKRPNQSLGEIYKVKLWSSFNLARSSTLPTGLAKREDRVLEKELFFSTRDFEDQDEIFSKLNIEGVTFGTDIGEDKLMVIVNDNGATENMPTYLMFFKVPAHLLAE